MVGFPDVCPTRSTRPNLHKNNKSTCRSTVYLLPRHGSEGSIIRLPAVGIDTSDTSVKAPGGGGVGPEGGRHQRHLGGAEPTRRGRRPRKHSTPGTPRDFGSNASGAVRQRLRSRGGQTHGPSPITRAAMGADSEGRPAAICPLRPRLAPILQHARQPKADGQLDCAALRAYGFILGGAFRSGRAGGRLGSRAETG